MGVRFPTRCQVVTRSKVADKSTSPLQPLEYDRDFGRGTTDSALETCPRPTHARASSGYTCYTEAVDVVDASSLGRPLPHSGRYLPGSDVNHAAV